MTFGLRLTTLALLLTAAISTTNRSLGADKRVTRPNVLLIVVDDMGYSDIGPFGGEIRTPNLDSLAKSGMVFTDFHTAPTCSPTRPIAVSWELFGFRAVRKGDFKLLWLPRPFGSDDWQLYDLASDPGELNDLSTERRKLRDEMTEIWEMYVRETGVILPSASPLGLKS